MSDLAWVTGVSIPFDSNGQRVLNGIVRAVTALDTKLDVLLPKLEQANVAIVGLGESAATASTGITDLAAAMAASARAANSAAAGARAAGAAYRTAAADAAAAAETVARANAVMVRPGASLFGGSRFAGGYGPVVAPALAGAEAIGALPPPRPAPLVPSPWSVYGARQYAQGASPGPEYGPIPQPSWRSRAGAAIESGAPQLALTGAVDAEWAAAYRAGRIPPNARGWWANWRARGGSAGSGPTISVPPGGFGGGPPPPPGGFPMFPPGAGAGWGWVGGVPARVGRMAWGAAKDVALGAAGYGADAVYEASKLQTILASIKNVTGANRAQMDRAYNAIFSAGHTAAIAPVQAGEMFREIARQSQGAMSFDDMLSLLPQMARMQLVLGATRGFSAHQTVDTTMALVHLFRQYNPKGQKAMMDTVLRMSELMPDNPLRAVTQMSYFEPLLKSLNVPDEDAAALMVALSRFGLGRGKGGTGVRSMVLQALGPLQLTTHAQGAKALMLRQAGLLDAHGNSPFMVKGANGKPSFDIFGFLYQLSQDAKKNPMAVRQIYSMLGMQGGNIGALMADPVIVDQLKKIHDAITKQKSLGLDAQSKTLMGQASFAMKGAWSDFQAVATEVGWVALPAVTRGFNDLRDTFHNVQVWLHQHRDVEKRVGKELVDDVQGVAQYFVAHRQDFINFGHDVLYVFDHLKDAGPTLGAIGNSAFRAASGLHAVLGAIEGIEDNLHIPHPGGAPKPPPPKGPQVPGWVNPLLKGVDTVMPFVGGYGGGMGLGGNIMDLFGRSNPAAETPTADWMTRGSRREHTRAVHHHHGNTIIQIHGGDTAKVEATVRRVIREERRRSSPTVMHGKQTTGAHPTSAHTPAPVSTPLHR